MSVYKACDIRGHAADELSPELYRRWGAALGDRVDSGALVVVGGDVRPSTPVFLDALISGLGRAGADVADLGIAPTPMVYYAARARRAAACAVVTASHSPPEANGLKWMVGGRPPPEAEVEELQRETETGAGAAAAAGPGARARLDIDAEYRAWLCEEWGTPGVAARVVLDPGNGCWAGRCGAYLAEVFPDARFLPIHDRADGSFPDRGPDCARPAQLAALSAAVRGQGADLGLAFDGDGDRVALVDNEGEVLTAEQATFVLLRSLGDGLRGRAFVHDIKFSDRVPEAARKAGARPRAERSGHAFIRTSMIEHRARFGAEVSGHYFYDELDGGDDGLYTACRLIRYLGVAGATLADLRRQCPAVTMTPDLRLKVEGSVQDGVLDRVQVAFRDCPQSYVDGVRVDFPQGWALIRKSVTEAAITCRCEGDSPAGLEQVVGRVCAGLGAWGSQLWDQYRKEAHERSSG